MKCHSLSVGGFFFDMPFLYVKFSSSVLNVLNFLRHFIPVVAQGGIFFCFKDCEKERPNRRPVNSPFTVYYDRCPFKSRKTEESVEGNLKRAAKGKETHEAKDWRKSEGHREDYWRVSESHRENNWRASEDQRESNWGIFRGLREDNWRISEDRRGDLSRTQGDMAWEKYLHDQNRHERKDRRNGEIERKPSTDKHSHRLGDKDMNRKHSSIQKKLKENANEKESGSSSQSTSKKARNEVMKKVHRNEKKMRSVEEPENEKRSELKREGGSRTEDSNERRHEKGVRNVDFRFAKGRHEEVTEHDKRAAAVNEKEGSCIEFSISGIEKGGKDTKKVLTVKRDNTKKNSSATEQTQRQSRKRTWNSSQSRTERLASCDESPFKIIKSSEVADLDESGNFEFIDLDIYADSDSSLEVIGKNYSGGYMDLPKEENIEDEDTKRGREKKLKLDTGYSTRTLGNRPHCSDTGEKYKQAADDEKKLKSTKDSGNKRDSSRSLERMKANQTSVTSDAAKVKTIGGISSRQRKIGVDVTELNRKNIDKAMPSKKVGKAEKMSANAQAHVSGTKEKQSFEKDNSAQVDRSSKDLSDRQLISRSFVRERPEGNRTVASNKPENIELVENKFVAKGGKSKTLSDFFPKSDKASINQTRLIPPEHTDLALRFFLDKSEQKTSNSSPFAHEIKTVKNKGETESSPSLYEESKYGANHKTSTASSVSSSVPPYDAWGRIVDKKWDGSTQEPSEKVFVEDCALWEDISDYESLSDPGDFQFSNMHFEPGIYIKYCLEFYCRD